MVHGLSSHRFLIPVSITLRLFLLHTGIAGKAVWWLPFSSSMVHLQALWKLPGKDKASQWAPARFLCCMTQVCVVFNNAWELPSRIDCFKINSPPFPNIYIRFNVYNIGPSLLSLKCDYNLMITLQDCLPEFNSLNICDPSLIVFPVVVLCQWLHSLGTRACILILHCMFSGEVCSSAIFWRDWSTN